MEEEKERKKSLLGSEKKKRGKSLFEWSKGEELDLLKMLVEFRMKKMADEEFYPFLRNGSLAEVPKIQIFNKIQELKKKYMEKKLEFRKMRIQYSNLEKDERDEGFELSHRVWGEVDDEDEGSGFTSKAVDVWNGSYFEGFFEGHALETQLFSPSFLETTKKDVDHLFSLQTHRYLVKANLKAQLAQLKYDIIQARFNNLSNQESPSLL